MKLVTNRMVDEWIAKAGKTQRLRTNFNIHESLSDPIQRLFVAADRYHTWIPMEEKSVFFEVKQGPYDPAAALSFAPWSPEESSPRVKEFQAKLLAARTGDRFAEK